MTAAAKRPETLDVMDVGIKVRRMDFDFSDDIPDYWYDQDPLLTLFLTALSATFPEGEKQFIQSVRNFQDQITDPELRKQIRAFIGQEAHHSKEHDALNDLMKRKGFPVLRIEKRMTRMAQWMRDNWSEERQLANTVCAEHITAIMADFFMTKSPQELEKLAPQVRKIWAWHVIEETEHKAVAFDVYQQLVNDPWLRRSQMVLLTVLFVAETAASTTQLLQASDQMRNWKMWLKGSRYFLGRKGMVWKLLPEYLDFYKKDFHPWQHQRLAELRALKSRYLDEGEH
ncbi:metal-dependent hydrolase [Ketobacter sp.]|uniref:metal-dependent hydrolase n=1 Tax=Ketobacter sp. TaxID=2083498 RepID=UPI000F1C43B9|nr:metal-dependent hydrolase [Ketobacter sp.]RLU01121.1 MAG: metal-dependent hydrolase [Ketobacter sp.]